MTPAARNVLIVGAGLAGARCAETLRAEGFEGRITLVGEEPVPGSRLAVIGAGFVGAEVASTARSLGVDVTLVDVRPPLGHILGREVGAILAERFQTHGVERRLGAGLSSAISAPMGASSPLSPRTARARSDRSAASWPRRVSRWPRNLGA